jgi:hypothetical protein
MILPMLQKETMPPMFGGILQGGVGEGRYISRGGTLENDADGMYSETPFAVS